MVICCCVFFFFKQKTAYDIEYGLVGSEMCIRDRAYIKVYEFGLGQETWFAKLKELATELGYTADRKAYKKSPESYKGMVADVAGVVRAALTHRANTPDLYTIMEILGEEKVVKRFNKFINL